MTEEFKTMEKLWDLANLITGFAIAQNIATTFAMAKEDLDRALTGPLNHWFAFAGIVVFTALYIVAIIWCGEHGSPHDPPDTVALWKTVTCGRVGAVLLFALVTLGTLYGHRMDDCAGKLNKYPQAATGEKTKPTAP